MSRCAICDHFEGHGSFINPTVRPLTRVRWRPEHKEYQCDDCFEPIRQTKEEWKQQDTETDDIPSIYPEFDDA